MSARTIRTLLVAAAFAAPAGGVVAQARTACDGDAHCVEVPNFVATVTDFRESRTGHAMLLSVTVRFQNRTNRPLVLGYVQGSALGIDDQGNRFTPVSGSLRGLGEIASSRFDPKFVLQPGESGDGRIELTWRPGNAIVGTRYVVELAVREIDPVAGNQWRLGREHALQFRGFTSAAAGTTDAPLTTPVSAGPAEPLPDFCENRAGCYAAGPFVAEIARVSESRQTHVSYFYHILTFSIRFRNVTNQPLVLAYGAGSAIALDDQGNRYAPTTDGNHVKGMGISRRNSADASFTLRPGETREATFQLRFQARPQHVLGTTYTLDLAVEQLEVLPRNQLRTLREYAVGYRDLPIGTPAAAPADAARRLLDAIRRRP